MNELPPSLWKTVATVGSAAWPAHSADDISRFVASADKHRLLPIAAGDPSLPSGIREAAGRKASETAAFRAAQIRDQNDLLENLRRILPAEWLMLKGADYRERLYSSAEARPMNDVDLLVRRQDTVRVLAALQEHGFALIPGKSSANETALRVPGSDLWLDIYDRFAHDTRVDVQYDQIWNEREITPDGLGRLAPHHALAVHTLIVSNIQFVTHLRKFVDLWLLSRNDAVVRGAMACAERWSLRRAFYVSFRVMRRLFPETAGEAWSGAVDRFVSARERAALDNTFSAAPFDALPVRPVQVWRKLRLLDTNGHRVRFVVSHLATTAAALARGEHSNLNPHGAH